MWYIFNRMRLAIVVLSIVCLGGYSCADGGSPAPLTVDEVAMHIKTIRADYPGSMLAEAQIEIWLATFAQNRLLELRKAIPSPWMASQTSMLAMQTNLSKPLTNARRFNVVSEGPESEADADAVFHKGFLAGKTDGLAALNTAKALTDPALKDAFLMGMIVSAGRADSFADAQVIRETIMAEMSHDQRHWVSSERWMPLWPAESIAVYADTLGEDKKFSVLRSVSDEGQEYFPNMDVAIQFLNHFGRSGPGQFPIVIKSLGTVFAARDPEKFLVWWDALKPDWKTYYTESYIGVLLRHNPETIHHILPAFSDSNSYTAIQIAREWARYDEKAAIEWVDQLPVHKVFPTEKISAPQVPPAIARVRNTSALPTMPFRGRAAEPISSVLPEANIRPVSIRKTLAKNAYPGAAAITNAALMRAIVSLEDKTFLSLLSDFKEKPAINAKEQLLRQLLLERWVFDDPMIACEWIINQGTHNMRTLLPLAVARASRSPENLKKLHSLILKIPEERIYVDAKTVIGEPPSAE